MMSTILTLLTGIGWRNNAVINSMGFAASLAAIVRSGRFIMRFIRSLMNGDSWGPSGDMSSQEFIFSGFAKVITATLAPQKLITKMLLTTISTGSAIHLNWNAEIRLSITDCWFQVFEKRQTVWSNVLEFAGNVPEIPAQTLLYLE